MFTTSLAIIVPRLRARNNQDPLPTLTRILSSTSLAIFRNPLTFMIQKFLAFPVTNFNFYQRKLVVKNKNPKQFYHGGQFNICWFPCTIFYWANKKTAGRTRQDKQDFKTNFRSIVSFCLKTPNSKS